MQGEEREWPRYSTSSLSALGRVSGGTGCIISEAQCKMAINAGLLFKIIKISR